MTVARTLKLALALAALVLVTGAPVAHAAYPGRNGKLAIQGFSKPGIWTVKPNGSDLTRVSGKNGHPSEPAWSPNGKWIAFAQHHDLWKMHADGSHKERLANRIGTNGQDLNISWSPNGRKLLFDKRGDLWTVRSNGNNPKPIFTSPAIESAPAWSPKGGEIAFEFIDPNTNPPELRLVAPDGSGETPIPSATGWEPDWSPNGKHIAYEDSGAILIVNPDGSGLRTFAKPRLGDPAWSPDGQQIAFAEKAGRNVFIVRSPVTGGAGQVVVGSRFWLSPSWQPK